MRKNIKISAISLGIGIILFGGICLAGCGNRTVFDTTYTFNRAIVKLADGTIVNGKVQNWTDYEDGDQIQVKINGNTYLVHSSNITLIQEGK